MFSTFRKHISIFCVCFIVSLHIWTNKSSVFWRKVNAIQNVRPFKPPSRQLPYPAKRNPLPHNPEF